MTPFSIEVEGSRGVIHVVTRHADGRLHCSCLAFHYGRGAYCRHILSMHRPAPVANAPAPALRGAA